MSKKDMKKEVLIVVIIAVVLIGGFLAYNIFNKSNDNAKGGSNEVIEYVASEFEEASVETYPNSVEIVENIYGKVKAKNTINFTPNKGEMMQEYITEYGFKDDIFEIYVKVFYIKENIEDNVTYYQIYADKEFTNKLAEVSQSDYNEGIKDNSADGINNYSLESLINSTSLKKYKYTFEYDKNTRKVTFKDFLEQ